MDYSSTIDKVAKTWTGTAIIPGKKKSIFIKGASGHVFRTGWEKVLIFFNYIPFVIGGGGRLIF